MISGKRILLIIGGGIAAYKSLELIRRLKERGALVRVILTRGGAQFITPLSVSSLSGEKTYTDLFSLTDEVEMGHIRLSREADLVLVAPATADLIAKMAAGLADDLASTTLLATNTPVMIAPAMNVQMWANPATMRNIQQLRDDGILQVGPTRGDLACGEEGQGRLAEVPAILEAVEAFFAGDDHALHAPRDAGHPLSGRRAVVTAGPTFEAIDPVRFLGNRSSGRQGYAIAEALAALGAEVLLVSGPTALADPRGVAVVRVESAAQMLEAVTAALPMDIAVCVAAVSDWRARAVETGKIKKAAQPPRLELAANPDILAHLSSPGERRPALVVGFAAETDNVVANARAKLVAKGCDWIVANDVAAPHGAMGGESNAVHLITSAGVEDWPLASKAEVAQRLADRIADQFKIKHAR